MAQAPRDQNRVPALLGTLNTDGITPTVVYADPATHALNVSDGTTGSDLGGHNAVRDQNRIPALLAVSSADGTTIVPVYTDANGNLMIDSS